MDRVSIERAGKPVEWLQGSGGEEDAVAFPGKPPLDFGVPVQVVFQFVRYDGTLAEERHMRRGMSPE